MNRWKLFAYNRPHKISKFLELTKPRIIQRKKQMRKIIRKRTSNVPQISRHGQKNMHEANIYFSYFRITLKRQSKLYQITNWSEESPQLTETSTFLNVVSSTKSYFIKAPFGRCYTNAIARNHKYCPARIFYAPRNYIVLSWQHTPKTAVHQK